MDDVGWMPWFVIAVVIYVILRRVTQQLIPKYSWVISTAVVLILVLVVHYFLGDDLLGRLGLQQMPLTGGP